MENFEVPSAPAPPAPEVVPPAPDRTALLAGIHNFDRESLKPATTVVYRAPVVDHRCGTNPLSTPTDEEVKEYHDSDEDLQQKAAHFAKLLQESRHFVVYTGAGISTAARIPDYRGPQGVWTLKAKGVAAKMPITLEQALPTYSHMALVALMKHGLLKYVVSTNVDGLHRRSGIPEDMVSELHGNVYREVCSNPSCNKEFLRTFDVTKNRRQRFTGRLCTGCSSRLVDSIVNFGESLPTKPLSLASDHSSLADLTLVLGSSMRVAPACDLPAKSYSKGGSFCICNLQKTPFDKYTGKGGIRIFARCDEFMRLVMKELDIPVDEFQGGGDEQIAKDMEEMIFDPSFDAIPSNYGGRVCMSMAEDAMPTEVLQELLAGLFALRSISVERKGAHNQGL